MSFRGVYDSSKLFSSPGKFYHGNSWVPRFFAHSKATLSRNSSLHKELWRQSPNVGNFHNSQKTYVSVFQLFASVGTFWWEVDGENSRNSAASCGLRIRFFHRIHGNLPNFSYIYHKHQLLSNVGKYTSPIDPSFCFRFKDTF